jgi:hypothetical protein
MLVSGCVNVAVRDNEFRSCSMTECPRPADAVILFDGSGFDKWIGEDGSPVKWKIVDGEMVVVPGSGSMVTKDNYSDFRLHVEFNIPSSGPGASGQARGNSGIYIQKRYEIQILDSYGLTPTDGDCGAIYKTKAPDKNVCREPGEWQTYDIFFRAPRWSGETKTENARITVLQNNICIHNNVEVPNKTGAGQPEGPAPGPIKLQDHGAPVRFRNIWIVPLP